MFKHDLQSGCGTLERGPTRTALVTVCILTTVWGVRPAFGAQEAPLGGKPKDMPDRRDVEVECDLAIEKALAYLAASQQKDGAWGPGFGSNTAVVSLAVMAFLAKGHVPDEGPYGEVVNRGVDFVLSKQQNNGLIFTQGGGPMYSHGISTLMLAEVVGMTSGERERRVRETLARAVKLILDAQRIKQADTRFGGGWRYQHTSKDSDLSVTGWCLMALKAAKNAGAVVPVEAINEAIAYVKRSYHQGGGFSYQPGAGPSVAMTSTGVLCLQIAGYHLLQERGKRFHAEALASGEWLLKHPVRQYGGGHFHYAAYYIAQAMWQLGGKYWESWQPGFERLALANQNADGSWPVSYQQAGPTFSTSMMVLALAVKYCYLPIYQR
ncbi:MAG: terpene cyclase/mutase family protein [Phycisphaerae bacterium]|nr:terpene cyclase/mutase family protein [Phycisphaerae bacterium]